MTILVTGAAGFIGSALCKKLLDQGEHVIGFDNFNDYYDVNLKESRIKHFCEHANFVSIRGNLHDKALVEDVFKQHKPKVVVNLAAQAGVRYSIKNPYAYIDSNIVGFLNILECCRYNEVEHLVYASSSSVYGANTKMPFSTHDNVDHPLSLYAATKKSNELMAHTYSHLYKIPTTGLRFFTVYGPWGRPDMAYFLFAKAITEGRPIDIFNNGQMHRDFTYVDDIVEGVMRVMKKVPQGSKTWSGEAPDPSTSNAPYKIYNIGNNNPVQLMHMIETLEGYLGITAQKNYLPMQPGDVTATYADVNDLSADVGFRPSTSIETGLESFVTWFKQYYK